MEEPVLFYIHQRYYFDNFQCYRIEIDGRQYRTGEHAYQSLRFRDTAPHIADMIMDAPSPYDAKKLKKQYIDQIDPRYTTQNPNLIPLMEKVIRAKYEQHEDVRNALHKTGDRIIAEDSPKDNFWGLGPNGNGENNLGKLWMKLRDEKTK